MNTIKYDFTAKQAVDSIRNAQPLAIMPADLAQKLLRVYANSLRVSNHESIIEKHIADLNKTKNMDEAIEVSLNFVEERVLIQNVSNEVWDAYEVKEDKIG